MLQYQLPNNLFENEKALVYSIIDMVRISNRLNSSPSIDRKLRRSVREKSRQASSRMLQIQRTIKKNGVTESQSAKTKPKSKFKTRSVKLKRLIRPIKRGTTSDGIKNRKKKVENDIQLDTTHKTNLKRKTLAPRTNITLYKTDPFFESCGKITVPFVSVSNYSKSSIRAVLTSDENLLKNLRADKNNVHSLHIRRSIDVNFDALTYALAGNKVNLVKILLDDLNNPITDRVHVAKSLITRQETGRYNFHMLGHAVRPIQMSRGGKEGTNAFLKDDYQMTYGCLNTLSVRETLEKSIRYGLEMNTLNRLQADDTFQSFAGSYLAQMPVVAVRWGRRKLAAQLIERFAKSYFNDLAVETLTNDRDKPLKDFKAVSVKKKAMLNQFITPVHCAAINPNVKYIRDLLAIEPDFNHADTDGYKPIHYAAVNESSSVLSYLLEKGASLYDATKRNGFTPLHLACEANRPENVRVICQYVSRVAPENLLTVIRHKTKNEGFNVVHLAARQ
uniref:Uncharacterized protein n=1 Tax=Romanomermis culicivorax TaxID=13658 RepID=A0A915KS96_ROMCU